MCFETGQKECCIHNYQSDHTKLNEFYLPIMSAMKRRLFLLYNFAEAFGFKLTHSSYVVHLAKTKADL